MIILNDASTGSQGLKLRVLRASAVSSPFSGDFARELFSIFKKHAWRYQYTRISLHRATSRKTNPAWPIKIQGLFIRAKPAQREFEMAQ